MNSFKISVKFFNINYVSKVLKQLTNTNVYWYSNILINFDEKKGLYRFLSIEFEE